MGAEWSMKEEAASISYCEEGLTPLFFSKLVVLLFKAKLVLGDLQETFFFSRSWSWNQWDKFHVSLTNVFFSPRKSGLPWEFYFVKRRFGKNSSTFSQATTAKQLPTSHFFPQPCRMPRCKAANLQVHLFNLSKQKRWSRWKFFRLGQLCKKS